MPTGSTGLSDIVQGLHAAAADFCSLLQDEMQQLQQWPLPDPWPLHAEKVRQVQALEALHAQLLQTLSRQGVDCTHSDHLQAAINSQLPAHMLALWQDTLTQLAECRQLNAVNGATLIRQQQAMRQSLDMLMGALDQGVTYGRLGGQQRGQRRLSLGLA